MASYSIRERLFYDITLVCQHFLGQLFRWEKVELLVHNSPMSTFSWPIIPFGKGYVIRTSLFYFSFFLANYSIQVVLFGYHPPRQHFLDNFSVRGRSSYYRITLLCQHFLGQFFRLGIIVLLDHNSRMSAFSYPIIPFWEGQVIMPSLTYVIIFQANYFVQERLWT